MGRAVPDDGLEHKVAFLRDHGVDRRDHSGQRLLDHLLGTRALLVAWGCSPAVCDAGLFHSVYGTQAYDQVSIEPSRRDEVRAVIGDEAEALAHLFGSIDQTSLSDILDTGRPTVVVAATGDTCALPMATWAALAHIAVANWIEQRPRLQGWLAESVAEEYSRLGPLLGKAAGEAVARATGPPSSPPPSPAGEGAPRVGHLGAAGIEGVEE